MGAQAELLDDPTLTVEGAQLLAKNGAATCLVLVRESSLQKIVVKVSSLTFVVRFYLASFFKKKFMHHVM